MFASARRERGSSPQSRRVDETYLSVGAMSGVMTGQPMSPQGNSMGVEHNPAPTGGLARMGATPAARAPCQQQGDPRRAAYASDPCGDDLTRWLSDSACSVARPYSNDLMRVLG